MDRNQWLEFEWGNVTSLISLILNWNLSFLSVIKQAVIHKRTGGNWFFTRTHRYFHITLRLLWSTVNAPNFFEIMAVTNFSLDCVTFKRVHVSLCFSITCSLCCCSVLRSCLTLCDPLACSTASFSVLRRLPEFAQIHVHWVSDAIWPSHPLPFPL